jgi:glycosyltransferase involved in cell wall biosynthesis
MNTTSPLKIAYLTSGAAGMFCGSCMHDNTLARALIQLGCDVQLIPLYTPIRTDEESVAIDEVFMGGINVYLQQKFSLFRHMPSWVDRLLDRPWLLNWATSRGMQTSAKQLGELTVSMLQGDLGFQRKEVDRLASWLTGELQPDIIVFSNMLTAGCVPAIKRHMNLPVVVTLQGDDIFLGDLQEPYKSRAFAEIRRLIPSIDGFIANSEYYADFMADYLAAPRDKFHIVPLGLDTSDFRSLLQFERANSSPPTIGYLARLAPEKGLHLLVDAFIHLHRELHCDCRLRIAGWLGPQHREYVDEQFRKLQDAGLTEKFDHVGEVDRHGKIDFLKSIDVLSVPTTYREPKGLFVLEALAAGVPVVQPNHGAFPELLARTGGGVLVPPDNATALAEQLAEALREVETLREVGRAAQATVHAEFSAQRMAERTLEALTRFHAGRSSISSPTSAVAS